MIYPLGLFEECIIIPYGQIKKVEKFTASLIPMGMAITYGDPNADSEIEERFTISKRDKWIAFLLEKARSSAQ